MPRYTYKARDQQQRVLSGTMEGSNIDEVLDRLAQRNFIPLTVDELNFDGSAKNVSLSDRIREKIITMQTKVPYKDVVFFTRQCATMIEAGVPLANALEQLAESEKPVFQKILKQVAADISMGSDFSDSIARHPGAFDHIYVAVIRSGEVAGALDAVMDELATYMENTQALREKVVGAMRYPFFISLIVITLISGILWKLVPIFTNMYGTMGADLPLITQVLVSVSNTIRDNTLTVFTAVAVTVITFLIAMTNAGFKLFIHKMILYVPVFGMIMKKNIWARFSRTMALLLESGTPILQAIEISGSIAGNSLYSQKLEQAYKLLRTGELLSAAIDECGGFPPLIKQLIATGESAGNIGTLLRKSAVFYEREIRVTVDSLASIIEPFLIVILGSIIGGVLIALYLPVFSMGQLMH